MGWRQVEHRAYRRLEILRREVRHGALVAVSETRASFLSADGAAPRQHYRARVDLRADRVRLCADLPGKPGAQSGAWRADDAWRVFVAGHCIAVLSPTDRRH